MDYQSKTTMVMITVWKWDEKTVRSLGSRFDAAHAIAMLIASRCHMDLMSFSPYSLPEKGEECLATVVYINNGLSLDEICRIMKPEIDNKPDQYWMLQDLYEWQGSLECIATTKGDDQEWN